MFTIRTRLVRALLLPALLTGLALLTACSPSGGSPQAPASAATPIPADQAYATLAAEGKGFTVGALMAANTVYVLFDPQCPHCGHLWNASLPLHGKLKFVWLPVSLMGAKSLPQGAALMQSSTPAEAMTAHEQSLLAGQGGMSASASVPDAVAASIRANTALLDRLGADSVPFIVARHAPSGQTVTHAGALGAPELAQLVGLETP
jgi:thiol:disulfide interchange protein DsbG